MSENERGRTAKDLGPRAKETLDLFDLYYRAEIAEALLRGDVPRSNAAGLAYAKEHKLKEPPSSVAHLALSKMKDMNRKDRHQAAKVILSDDMPKMRKLTKGERQFLQKVVDPKSEVSLIDRMDLPKRLVIALNLPDDFQIKKPGDGDMEPIRDVIGDFYPMPGGFVIPLHHDGRPEHPPEEDEEEDEEPGEPTQLPFPPAFATLPRIPADALHFVIEEIRCQDTTNGEAGRDEIAFDGVATDFPLWPVFTTPEARVQDLDYTWAGSFSVGDARTYSPGLVYARFSLNNAPLPHFFDVTYLMAETDPGGGLVDAMDDMAAGIRADIQYIVALVGTVIGGAFSVVGLTLGLVGLIAGAYFSILRLVVFGAIFLVLGVLQTITTLGLAATLNVDDLFEPTSFGLMLDQDALSGDPFNGGTRTPTRRRVVEGDGGRYRVSYHWELVGGPQSTSDQDEA